MCSSNTVLIMMLLLSHTPSQCGSLRGSVGFNLLLLRAPPPPTAATDERQLTRGCPVALRVRVCVCVEGSGGSGCVCGYKWVALKDYNNNMQHFNCLHIKDM